MAKCPNGGCSKGEPRNIHIEGCGTTGGIYCSIWNDISWHPVSKGRECPYPLEKRPEPHWWEGKDRGEKFGGWKE